MQQGGRPSGNTGQLNQQIFQWFRMADTSHSGKLDFHELSHALKNDANTAFRPETCRMMISMFDREGDGQINPYEFEQLWNYLSQWRQTFNNFDQDRSGEIDRRELVTALQTMGYRLSETFIQITMAKFDPEKRGNLRFDDFIRLCCILNSLTTSFAVHDPQRQGRINVTYEEFLTMVFMGML